MEKLLLEGVYNYKQLSTGFGLFKGTLNINSDGLFEGEIYDYGSNNPEQLIKGYFKLQEEKMNMVFFKFNSQFNKANILYQLTNQEQFHLEGKYEGVWQALPFKFDFYEDMGLFIQRIDKSIIGISDYAHIKVGKNSEDIKIDSKYK